MIPFYFSTGAIENIDDIFQCLTFKSRLCSHKLTLDLTEKIFTLIHNEISKWNRIYGKQTNSNGMSDCKSHEIHFLRYRKKTGTE